MAKLKIGLIGTGGMGTGHLKCLKQINGIEVAALCDTNKKNLDKAGKLLLEKPKKFNRCAGLLAVDELDAVIIATPNYTHKDITIAALKSGKHVLCEKPMATNVADCQAMIKAARKYGKKLQIGLELRYFKLYQKMKKIVSQNQIGRPQMIWCHEFRAPFLKKVNDWILKQDKSGGSLVEKDCHHFDLFNWLAESKPLRVSAVGGGSVVYSKRDILDHAWVITEYENGIKTCLGLCLFSPRGNDPLTIGILGAKGKLESSHGRNKITVHDYKSSGSKVYAVHTPPRIKKLSHGGGVYYEHKAFFDAVRKDKDPYPGAQIGLWSVVVGVAAEQSVREKRVIEVKDILR